MTNLYRLYILKYIIFCSYVLEATTLCPQPGIPVEGKYTPQQRKFEPGDEITYSCKKGFALAGKERRICKLNGVWSDHTPFCDRSIPLSDPSTTNKISKSSSLAQVIDGNSSTCFDWVNATGEHLFVRLEKKTVVRILKMFLKKGITKIEILTGRNNDMKLCADYHNFIETDRWIEIKCKSSVLADTVKILVVQIHSKFFSICEIEVYGKEEDSCEHSPSRIVQYGHFEISRSKATLICEEGYKSENNRLVCEGNNTWSGGRLRCEEILCDPPSAELSGGEWHFLETTRKLSAGTKSELKCVNGYKKVGTPDIIFCQPNGTWTKTNATCIGYGIVKDNTRAIIFGSVGMAVVIIIIALLAVTIHFIRKQRNKEVVVVYQTHSDGSIPLSREEIEYSSPRYEPLKTKPPEPPSTLRPTAKQSTISRYGNKQSDNWKNTMVNRSIPPDITLGTMKASTIYGS